MSTLLQCVTLTETNKGTVRTNASFGATLINVTRGIDMIESADKVIVAKMIARANAIVKRAPDLNPAELAEHVRTKLKEWHRSLMIAGFDELEINVNSMAFPEGKQVTGAFFSLNKVPEDGDPIDSVVTGKTWNARVTEIVTVLKSKTGTKVLADCTRQVDVAEAAAKARANAATPEAKATATIRKTTAAMIEACETTADLIALRDNLVAMAEAQAKAKAA
jgi:hypothetical protein